MTVGDEDPGFAGGSYVIVQKYLHDLDGVERAQRPRSRSGSIGRTKLDDIELPDDVKPSNSHVALNTITGENGEERQIVRDNMPFGTVGDAEFGTYFIGYATLPRSPSRCCRTCSSATRRATTTESSTSRQR